MMDKVILEILADRNLVDEVSESGFAEIALRRADAKFKALVKCKVLGNEFGTHDESISMVSEMIGKTDCENVKSALYLLKENTELLSSDTKKMSFKVEDIFKKNNTITKVSYLNTGLTLANLAVDVIGFTIVSQKLNTLNNEIQKFKQYIENTENILKNEKISYCQKLIMQCNLMFAIVKDNDEINLEEFEKLLIEMKSFISEMILNLHDKALKEEIVLNMIFTLMPAYTALLCEFLKHYYYKKNRIPDNYDIFISLYKELISERYIELLENHFFINEKYHFSDVIDMINAHIIISINGMAQVEEQSDILKILGSKEKIILFEDTLNSYIDLKLKKAVADRQLNF